MQSHQQSECGQGIILVGRNQYIWRVTSSGWNATSLERRIRMIADFLHLSKTISWDYSCKFLCKCNFTSVHSSLSWNLCDTEVQNNSSVVLISRLLLITNQVLIETIDSEGYTPAVQNFTSRIAWRNEIPMCCI